MNNKNKNMLFSSLIAIAILSVININLDKQIGTDIIGIIATPYSGEDLVLPKEVRYILRYLRSSHVKTICVSPRIASNRFISQPLTESIYPIIIKDMAELYISYSNETLPVNCFALESEKGIRIARCH